MTINNTPFKKLPLSAIKPKGWLHDQLQLQAEGLTGHLEEIWEDVGANSGWLGGSGEKWERGPYYCDGLIPLAHLLEDEGLLKKAEKWIEWTLESQREDGFFGPPDNKDWWPRMVMLKVLMQHYEATKDERIISFMSSYFKYEFAHIKEDKLRDWGAARSAENVLAVFWLYSFTKEDFLIELADELLKQGIDWTSIMENLPFKETTHRYMNWQKVLDEKINLADRSKKLPYLETHIVNVAMGIKYPAICYQLYGKESLKNAIKAGIEALTKYHGTANGMFTGDEHLNGNNPTQGSELCAVVEYMFSLENILEITADSYYGDLLEKVAYNALPATIKDDFTAHQYDQQVNQVLCSNAPRNWYNNLDDSNIFGLEPNFGCCTANMHQGWPKFVQYLWMSTDDKGLCTIAYAPCEVIATAGSGTKVKLSVDTQYPFRGKVTIKLQCEKADNFPLKLRIPAWCANTTVIVNGTKLGGIKQGEFHIIHREWKDGDVIELHFPMEIRISKWYKDSLAVERGPLLYALKVKENWNKIKGEGVFGDWEVIAGSPWNYALSSNIKEFTVTERDIAKQPFASQNPTVEINAKARRVKGWGIDCNSAGEIPASPVGSDKDGGAGEYENVILIPYGAARLRIAQFPWF